MTIAFWTAGHFPGRRVLPYVGAQVYAFAGSALVKLVATSGTALDATLPTHGPGQAFGLEVLLTF